MATYGRLEEFDENRESWASYAEGCEAYFRANEIEDGEKRKWILLSAVGTQT